MPRKRSVGLQKALGKVIRERRERLGLSQEGFADLVGVHRTYMGALERGERNVSLNNLVRTARALEIRLWQLIRDAERKMPGAR